MDEQMTGRAMTGLLLEGKNTFCSTVLHSTGTTHAKTVLALQLMLFLWRLIGGWRCGPLFNPYWYNPPLAKQCTSPILATLSDDGRAICFVNFQKIRSWMNRWSWRSVFLANWPKQDMNVFHFNRIGQSSTMEDDKWPGRCIQKCVLFIKRDERTDLWLERTTDEEK